MAIRVVYPVPNESPEAWELFKPFVQRFCDGWRQFPPGCECELVPVLFGDDPTGKVTDLFAGLPVDQFQDYRGGGMDIGAAQWVAVDSAPNDLIIALTSRVYPHRAGWVNQLAVARELYGPGLYGTSASHEGGKLHCCTRCYATDAGLWNTYPHLIESRNQGCFFEVGRDNEVGAFSDWFESIGLPVIMVYWSGCRRKGDWFTPENIFRRGNQENLLVFDKHTDVFLKADPEEQRRLAELCFSVADIPAKV